MAMLEVEHLVKTYSVPGSTGRRAVLAVDDVNLSVGQGEFFTLLGPSGCGKTTTLRSIAGLERPDEGRVVLADRVLFSSAERVWLPANRRGIGMVFQSYAIWPHMNVYQNVAFPLELAGRKSRFSRDQIRQRVERALSVVQLDHLASRRATDLSGGQQQRLALARALVMEPPLLLLDEPLSNLDAKLREEMRFEIKRLQHELGVTAVYVTHDQEEALAISDKIAIMHDGKVEQMGTPDEIYLRPTTRFAAGFVGACNFIEGTVSKEVSPGVVEIESTEGLLRATTTVPLGAGQSVMAMIRPEHVQMIPLEGGPADPDCWTGVLENRAFLGDAVDYVARVGDRKIRVRSHPTLLIDIGSPVNIALPSQHCTILA